MKTLILSAIVVCISIPALGQIHYPNQVQPLPNMQQQVYTPPPPQPVYRPALDPQTYAPPPMQPYQAPRQTTCQFIGNMMYCN